MYPLKTLYLCVRLKKKLYKTKKINKIFRLELNPFEEWIVDKRFLSVLRKKRSSIILFEKCLNISLYYLILSKLCLAF